MARKAKFKAGEQVTYSGHTGECSLFISNKGQYVYRNNPVVDLRNAVGDLIAKAISTTHVNRLPEGVSQPITNSILRGTTEQVTDTCASNTDYVKTVDKTLDERGNRYGDFSDHARIAQDLQDVMRNFTKPAQTLDGQDYTKTPWSHLTPVAKQALTVIADKIARILNGDPNYADNWHDIQGYAKLVEDRLPKAE